MKKILKGILKWTGIALLTAAVSTFAWAKLWGRWTLSPLTLPQRVEVTWAEARADGAVSPEEIAAHYAPEINAAVNVLLSDAGRGDFIAAVDFDGDARALNNWENMTEHPLQAVVYYSVQETDTHYFVGYYFYHPRDDAEIWLDRHENDFEGIMLAVPRSSDGFLPPEFMYTQGHGNVFFYLYTHDMASVKMLENSIHAGHLLLEGDRAVVYIAPNGTLFNAGHSVESAAGNSTYWAVGNSGVRYYHGGEAQEPATFNGAYEKNRCSYALRPLTELWDMRSGPYGDDAVFGDFGAFRGENFGTNRANPPWGWRNKTIYGFGGSFLSDPVWTFNQAVSGLELSAEYVSNPFADWRIGNMHAAIPAHIDASKCTLHLIRDGWELSNPAWFTLEKEKEGFYRVRMGHDRRDAIWLAAPASATWRMEVRGASGELLTTCAVGFDAEYLPGK